MKIVVVGNGVYVSGRGTRGYGTILPAVFEYGRENPDVDEVIMLGTNVAHAREAKDKAVELMNLMQVSIKISSGPESETSGMRATAKFLGTIPGPCCAIVAVPDHLHYPIATMCIEAGMHILVVKPLAPRISEVDQLVKILEKKKLYGAVEFHKRYDRHNRKLKEVFMSGQLGNLLYCDIEYSQKKHVPSADFTSWVDKTNIVQYLGVHYIDMIYFLTGACPTRAQAVGQDGWLRERGIQAYDTIHTTIEWELGSGHKFYSFMRNGWIDPESSTANSDQKIKLVGTRGRFESDQKRRGLKLITDENGVEDVNPDFCSTYLGENGELTHEGYGIQSVRAFLEDVIQLVQGEITIESLSKSRPTFEEARFSTAAIEAVAKGLETPGHWVDVPN